MRQLMIVRRRDGARVRFLRQKFAGKPVEVISDRRLRERRQQVDPLALERRHSGGRRSLWPTRWAGSDLIVGPPAQTSQVLVPESGDVLVAKEVEPEPSYSLTVTPGSVQARYDAYEIAVERARAYATFAGVDVWYTEDRTAFVLLGPYRHPTELLAAP